MSQSPFIKFNLNLETFISNLETMLNKNRKSIQELLAIKSKTYANFVKPFELLDDELDNFFTPLSHINSTHNSKESQEVYTNSIPLMSEYSTEIGQNLELYTALKEVQKNETNLNTEQKRVLELNVLGFELSGAHLENDKKERLKVINLRKSELTNEFSQNLLDATNAFELIIDNEEDVKGIAQSDLDDAKVEIDGKTTYKFTLQMPSYIAYMTYGPNSEIREKLYKAYTTRAPENAKIIDELLSLRNEMAILLGYESYSAYSLASKMAEKTDDVITFLEELALKSKKQGNIELQHLKEFLDITQINSYDFGFYSEKLKKAEYDIDEEIYRPYFEQNRVVNGLFDFLEKLFGITCKESDDKLNNIDAKVYDIYIQNKLQARLIMDLEARKDKRGGAWMHNWQTHHLDNANDEKLASAFIVCNFPSSKNGPSLLRHDDVVTLFHEMGHAIHHVLSTVKENGVSGVNGVEWDAVEFPSQFLENFAYEPQVLKMFASHHETKEIISDEMIDKIVKSKNFQSALGMLRQIEFSLFDFKLHSKLYKGDEVQTLLDELRKDTALITPPSYNKFQNGFAHIFAGGYAAGYYSYKWAEVLSADLFFEIVDNGIFESPLAKGYKDIVLSRGGSESMSTLFKELMHRDIKTENLLRLNGIA